MKVRFWVVSAKGQSLRESLNNDLDKDKGRPEGRMKYPVRLQKEHKIDRSPGWSWVHSRQGGKGAIKYRWNPHLMILECWAVTKMGNRPSQLIGEFVESVLNSQRGRIKSIHIEVS